MALTYDQISSITQKYYVPKLIDNIFDSDPLLQRAKSEGWYTSVAGGTSIMQPLMYATLTAAGSYAPTATLDTTDSDSFTSAEYQWRFYYANITIARSDELKNSGDAQVLDFVKNKTMAAEMTLKDTMGTDLYNVGTAANQLNGLRLIVGTANTVGGISQTTYSWWAANADTTTSTLSMSALQTQYNNTNINGKTVTVLTATRANYNRYYALLAPQQRFVDSKTAAGGFSSLMFNGVPMIVSPKCPANHIFFLNEEFLNLYYHPEENFRFEPFVKPVNQNVKSGKIYWAGNIGSSNNRMHSKLSALTA